ncbi:MAG: DNA primase [Acidimicrobiales bacterium]
MGIADEDIAKVREATDIVAVVSEHLQLKRVGRRWVGLCPFHNEKTPSFSVNQQDGFYHCFGCQASGDAITFVRELEGMDFVGAVERLAAKAGVTLTYTSANEGARRQKRAKLVEAVEAAVDWYHDRLLTGPDAGPARAYLRERGITGDEVRAYRLGWAPDDWDLLSKGLKTSDKVLADAGLSFKNRRNRLQDTFRARILFPIYDINNDPVGFGGRKLPDAEGPKYKNSSESAIYSKSRLLYGLNWAKEHIVKADEVIICEGYTDVMGYARAGLPRAVATCGTALTEDHVKILKRFASRIVLSFDADAAGQAAAERFYEWEKAYDVDVRVAALPAGVDPDDLAQTDPEALRAAVEQAQPFLSFRVDRAIAAGDLTTVEGRARAADAAVNLVKEHPNPLVRDQYVVQIAERCSVAVEPLRAVAEGRSRRTTAAVAPADGSQSVDIDLVDTVERQVLRVAVHQPALVPDIVTADLFEEPAHREAFLALLSAETLPDAVDQLEGGAQVVLRSLIVEDSDDVDTVRADKLVGRLVDEATTRELRRLEHLARTTDDPAVGRRVAELHRARDQLRNESWGKPAAEALVAWLQPAEQL